MKFTRNIFKNNKNLKINLRIFLFLGALFVSFFTDTKDKGMKSKICAKNTNSKQFDKC